MSQQEDAPASQNVSLRRPHGGTPSPSAPPANRRGPAAPPWPAPRPRRKHGGWAKASRSSGYYTREGLEALLDDYIALLARYGYAEQDAPPGARLMQLRMFYIPDEPDNLP